MADDPLRLCLVAPLPPPQGGIARWTVLVRACAARCAGLQLDLLDTAPRWRAVDDLARWKRALGGGGQLLRDLARFAARLRAHPHVVHLTTSGQLAVLRDLCFLALARRARVPVVYHLHFGRVPEIAAAGTREWRLLALAMRRAHTVAPIDAATEAAIRARLPEVRVVRVPNAVDLATLPPPGPMSRTVLYLGWVIPSKGIEELIQAWADLRPAGWRLCLVGPGDPAYRQALLERHAPEGVDFTGELPHAAALRALAAAEIFVLPSHTEAFPNVVLEAMALGKAIVATAVGAVPELLGEDRGVLVPPRDVASLRQALAEVLANETLRRRLGEAAGDRARTAYALETVFAGYLALWRRVAAGLEEEECRSG